MVANLVVFQGEMYHIVKEAIAQTKDDNNEIIFIQVAMVEKVEGSKHPHYQHAFWTPLKTLKSLPSNIDYQFSEWSLGIEIGYRDAS